MRPEIDSDHSDQRRGEPKTTEPALITAAELAQMLNISARTLWRLRSAGKIIQPLRIGGSVRWRLDEVRNWISQGCPPLFSKEK